MTRSVRHWNNASALNFAADSTEQHQGFQVAGLRKEIHRMQAINRVRTLRVRELFEIPGLGGGVTAEIGEVSRRTGKQGVQNGWMESTAWWIHNDRVTTGEFR